MSTENTSAIIRSGSALKVITIKTLFIKAIILMEQEFNILSTLPSVALVFGSRSRHIAFDGKLLCATNHKSAAGGYSHGHYCSYSLDNSDLKKERTEPDVDYKGRGGCHSTGVIQFKPLNEIEPKIIERSICKKCLSKYNRELQRHKIKAG
jgi:hypothetical protein